jgi:hypothetical protein
MTPGPGGVKLVIHNFVKPDDSMTLTIEHHDRRRQQTAHSRDAKRELSKALTNRFPCGL